ncbi:MAG: type VI secretion system tip protein TssI/VgrG [Lentisphaerota bacterium]
MTEQRQLHVTMPRPNEAELLLQNFSGNEELGRLFQYELDLVSSANAIPFDQIVGQDAVVTLTLPDVGDRYFHGIVSRFSQVAGAGPYFHYQATVVPRLWLLTRRVNCRIFQKADYPTIADVIFGVLQENNIEFEKHLDLSLYREWEYCVQYRESDFNFISRLMEQEGIYYYFKHEEDKHTLILCDAPSKHDAVPEYEQIPYNSDTVSGSTEQISEWIMEKELQTADYRLGDFDFQNPQPLVEGSTNEAPIVADGSEIFDYPGEFTDEFASEYQDHTQHGEQYARIRIQELRAQAEVFRGRGDARGLTTGYVFELQESPRTDQNIRYLVTSAHYQITTGEYETGTDSEEGETTFQCSFTALDAEVQYRPLRATPKPMIRGPQTALVAGASEIDVDRYGRVVVQFHWDREGQSDENASCRVRVVQNWAGARWGGVIIPRKGQEVVVEFLEGDPDRPIITGSVYNEDHMPPYDLPGNKTQLGIKSRSSPEGADSNYNEIRFEEKKGEEELVIHAERNESVSVEADRSVSVGHDDSVDVGNDRTLHVTANDTYNVDGNRDKHVIGKEKAFIDARQEYYIQGGRVMQVSSGGETYTVFGGREKTVHVREKATINGPKEETVDGNKDTIVTGSYQVTVNSLYHEFVKDHVLGAETSDETLDKTKTITATSKIEFTVGGSSITIDASKVEMKMGGNSVMINAGGITITGKPKVDINP